jgi:hypothetical protein
VSVPSAQRLAENEALFREVNERVAELGSIFGSDDGDIAFVCECAMIDCAERLPLTLAEYRRLRERTRCFAVKPGHEVGTEIERVVGEHCEFVVVQKHDDPEPDPD